jgi:uncharacterized protein YndB with AHSA1/START domain
MPDIKHQFTIKAPVAKVYESISQISGLKSWWTTDTEGEEKQGGVIRFGFGPGSFNKMKINSLKKDQVVRWHCVDGPSEWIGTRLGFELSEDKDKQTVVKFDHSGWKEAGEFYASCNYHWGLFMRSLKALCETGQGTPHVVG